jgi:hypothetical protein
METNNVSEGDVTLEAAEENHEESEVRVFGNMTRSRSGYLLNTGLNQLYRCINLLRAWLFVDYYVMTSRETVMVRLSCHWA